MPPIFNWLNTRLGNNSLEDLVVILVILSMVMLLRRFICVVLSRLIFRLVRKKSRSSAVKTFEKLLSGPLEWLFTLIAVYLCAIQLDVHSVWNLDPVSQPGLLMFLDRCFQLGLIFSVSFMCVRLIEFFAQEYLQREIPGTDKVVNQQLIPFFKELIKVFVWILSFFFSLGFVFNLNIASIVAGLGLGGLAVALAAKESLENLFASFTIFLDKPFVVGDLVTVNNITGTIEKVGFRSTRIRTLEKSFLTLPNKLMIDNALDNLSLRTHRRADMNLSFGFDTPREKLEALLSALRTALNQHPRCTEESQIRFVNFGDSALIIKVLYYIDTIDFDEFMKIREEVNFIILDLVRNSGCQLSYPTQTLVVSPSGTPGES